MEETKGGIVYSTDGDALWEDSHKELSYDDLGHWGPSDGRQTIQADKINCCLVFGEIKMYEPIINCLIS
jgi:hypothetical protein